MPYNIHRYLGYLAILSIIINTCMFSGPPTDEKFLQEFYKFERQFSSKQRATECVFRILSKPSCIEELSLDDRLRVMEMLIKRGGATFDTHHLSVSTPLMIILKSNLDLPKKLLVMKWLLDHKAPVNARSSTGATVFMQTIRSPHMILNERLAIMDLLHGYKADMDQQNSDGQTTLIEVTLNINQPLSDRLSIMQWLVDHGASVNAQARHGMTTLMKSATNYAFTPDERFTIMQWLLDHGADIDMRDIVGYSAFMLTTVVDMTYDTRHAVMKFLFKQGADINALSNRKTSALVKIVIRENLSLSDRINTIQWLLKRGALIGTAVINAAIAHHIPTEERAEIIQKLVTAGARVDIACLLNVAECKDHMPWRHPLECAMIEQRRICAAAYDDEDQDDTAS